MYIIDTPVDNLWCYFWHKLLTIINIHIPRKVKTIYVHQLWVNCTVTQLRRQKQHCNNKAESTDSSAHWLHYKQLKKEMQKECIIIHTINEYMSDVIHESHKNGKETV